ncbi:hypothetical protein GCM10022252_48080 [Streptosporangium oxazolinicum]|uniref:Thymidylate kinase n=1 Tax=Streptosporangium oxazolinicum TaxID=909287 RepID=A0ABP8B5E4_9ACTN
MGKSYLIDQVAVRLEDTVTPLAELPDVGADRLSGRLVAALQAGGDPFLRTGFPLAETFTLLGLAVRRYEHVAGAFAGKPTVVLEDRGTDTVAVYQAVILTEDADHESEVVLALLDTAAAWCPAPDLSVLLLDDPDLCLVRWEERTGVSATPDQRRLMARAHDLYLWLARRQPHRYTIIDRRELNEEQTVEALAAVCRALASREER